MSSAKSAQESPVVGVVVTHNSEKYLPDLLASIENQTRKLDQLIVVDDNSTDSTSEILASNGITLVVATTGARDTVTRIARNFLQGAQLAPRDSIIIVGDHDDTWFPNRVEHQSKLMNKNPTIAMLASDGTTGTNQTLRSTFPVPNNWNTLSKSSSSPMWCGTQLPPVAQARSAPDYYQQQFPQAGSMTGGGVWQRQIKPPCLLTRHV